ncbi:MAG: heavy metal-responsive transcriptional regulator [Chloroflexi bacterium]|nr:heavy metal-responsive transcriptional regulator [Chloroflexota bacterium]MBI4504587.1 heavy metal-responsive transcriptional regulator [Chloroflexota bacterium]
MQRGLTIGELGRRVGVPAKTVRYYDLVGLLRPAGRTPAGYRVYGEREVARLAFIRKAKRVGLSLDAIADILALYDQGERPCQEVCAAIERKIAQLDRQIAELLALRDDLTRLRDGSEEAAALPGDICPVIERAGDSRPGH